MARDIFANSRRLKRGVFLKRTIVSVFVLGVITAALISFFYIPYFKVTSIEISGVQSLNAATVESAAANFIAGREFWILPRSSIFVLSEDMIVSHLMKSFPRLNQVAMKIDGVSPAAALISLSERTTWAVVCRVDSCFYASADGFLFERAPADTGSFFLRIDDNRDESYDIGSVFINRPELDRIQTITGKIKSATNADIDTISLNKKEVYYYEAFNDTGWKIIFDSLTDPVRAAENFALAYKDTFNEDLSKVDYIDLRLENRIFYKEK